MHTLDPLPDHIGPLRPNHVFEALVAREPGMWRNPDTEPCLTCRGKKTFKRYVPTTGEVVEYECDCVQQWILYVHLLNAGIRVGYQRSSWDDLDEQVPDDVMETIVGYVEQADRNVRAGRSLVLRGSSGTGKTLLAVLVLKHLISKGYNGRFVFFHDLLNSYTGGWKKGEDAEMYRRYLSADFLVIDEVHARTVGGMQHVGESMFDHVLRTRISDDRPTIITTNLTMDDIQVGYGSRVMSLLAESGVVVEVTGTDFRVSGKERQRSDIEWTNDAVRPLVLR